MAALRVYQGIATYSAAKHDVIGVMKTMAAELAPHSIRLNSMHLTQVNTPTIMNEETFKIFRPTSKPDPGRLHGSVGAAEPLDISKTLVFLASDDARGITGVTLRTDAALLLK